MDSSPSVAWRQIDGHRCLSVRFVGNLTADEARTTLDEIREALSQTDEQVTMVWDAAEMTGYETEARTLWQEGMADLKPRIDAIHLVAESAIIRMGACRQCADRTADQSR